MFTTKCLDDNIHSYGTTYTQTKKQVGVDSNQCGSFFVPALELVRRLAGAFKTGAIRGGYLLLVRGGQVKAFFNPRFVRIWASPLWRQKKSRVSPVVVVSVPKKKPFEFFDPDWSFGSCRVTKKNFWIFGFRFKFWIMLCHKKKLLNFCIPI